MNELFFDKIDTEKKAYWLGFLYADGYHITSCNKIGMKLAIRDVRHIEKFCQDIGYSPEKIKIHPPNNRWCMGRIIKSNGSGEINICNKHLSIASISVGLIPNKSLIIQFPTDDIVPRNLLNHFIRGYFDGDGCLGKVYSKNATRYRVIILSSKNFCEGMCFHANNILDINMKVWDKKNTNIYKTCISGNRQVKKFMDWLYQDATIYLDRKYDIYKELCEKIKKIDIHLEKSYSKYNNITYDKSRNKWIAKIRLNKKTVHLGRFDTEEEAHNQQLIISKESVSNQHA